MYKCYEMIITAGSLSEIFPSPYANNTVTNIQNFMQPNFVLCLSCIYVARTWVTCDTWML